MKHALLLLGLLFVTVGIGFLVFTAEPEEDAGVGIATPSASSSSSAAPALEVAEAPPPAALERATAADADTTSVADAAAGSSPLVQLVQTVDPAGRPVAGVPVAWSRHADRIFGEPAVLTEGPQALARMRLSGPPGGNRRYLHAVVLAPQVVSLEFTGPTEPGVPLVLTVPELGAVRVELAPELRTYESARLQQEVGDDPRMRQRAFLAALNRECVDGVAEFPGVAIGQRLLLQMTQPSGGGALERIFDGPTHTGETVVVRIEAGSDPVLIGRLLDTEGFPLAEASCHSRIESDGMAADGEFSTDAEGRFRIVLGSNNVRGKMKGLQIQPERIQITEPGGVRISVSGWGFGNSDPSRRARVPLPHVEPVGVYDLGDVMFESAPILVAGRVVDAAGAPIEGVHLQVEQWSHQPVRSDPIYRGVDGARARSDQDGAFRICCDAPEEALRLRAQSAAFLTPPPLDFVAGREGVVVVMSAAGSVTGTLRFPVGGSFHVAAHLLPDAGGSSLQTTVNAGPDSVGKFHFRPVAAGSHALQLKLEDHLPPFHVVPGVSVAAGGETVDPRLQGLDLAQFLHVYAVRVRTTDGAPIPGSIMLHVLSESGARGRGVTPLDGVVPVLGVMGVANNYALSADGFLTVELPALMADREVLLERAPRIVLRVLDDVPLAGAHGPAALEATWTPTAGISPSIAMLGRAPRRLQPDAHREMVFTPSRTGEYWLSWWVPGADGKQTRSPAGTITVAPGDDGRVFTIPPPALE